MGKTKTAFVSDQGDQKKSSEEVYREKKERQATEADKKNKGPERRRRVHIAGLKGGQRIKMVEAETPIQDTKILDTEILDKKAKTGKVKTKTKVRGRKYQDAKSKIDRSKFYAVSDGVKLAKVTSYSKFDGTLELHLIVKKAGISSSVSLPYSAGKKKRIEIASDETIKKLESNKIDFDVLLATAEFMPKLVPFAKILGPKGLMPNPKTQTLIKDEKDAAKFSGNTLNLKTEKDAPLIHTVIGKVSQKDEELVKNTEAILAAFTKDKQIVRAYMKSTMGPSIKIAIS